MDWAGAVLNGNVFGFGVNKFGLLIKKLFCNITYTSYCAFLHLLLKHDYVGVYSRFRNLFKTFFYFKLCEMLVSVWFVKYIFLSDFIYNRHRMILKNAVDFIIIVTGWSIKTREKDRNAIDSFVSMAFRFLSPTKLNRNEIAVYS